MVGTQFYVSPEMLAEQKYSFSSDLWAFAVIVYQLYSNKLPFCGKTQEDTFDLIRKGEYQMDPAIPPDVQDLLKNILVLDPYQRLGARNLNDLNQHEVFRGIDLNEIKSKRVPMILQLSKG